MLRLAVRVRREHSELVLAELLELAPGGVEEVEVPHGIVEYAVYGAPGELPALPALTAAAGGALVEVSTQEIADDWPERWRDFHRPLVLDGRLTVRPPWEPPGLTPIDVVIDPGQAFGTGAHATTRLCLELMLGLPPVGRFVDLGCGSGVLAIAAAKLGWEPVLALDIDRAAVEATDENARCNGVAVEARRFDLRSKTVPVSGATVAANLLAPLLLEWARRLRSATGAADDPGSERLTEPGPERVNEPGPERVIASGLLRGEEDLIADAFARCGYVQTARRERGEWAALLLERGAGRWPCAAPFATP